MGAGFVIRIPEAEPQVSFLRQRHDSTARLGMPVDIIPHLMVAQGEPGVLDGNERNLSARLTPVRSLARTVTLFALHGSGRHAEHEFTLGPGV